MDKLIKPVFRFFLFFSVLNGLVYPLFIWALSQLLFPIQSNGSLVYKNGHPTGSHFIGQKFTGDAFFWGRPSASDYETLPSSGSSLSVTSEKLKTLVEGRVQHLKEAHAGTLPPSDLVYASASGLDPDISKEAALYQLERVAKARSFSSEEIRQLKELIQMQSTSSYWKILPSPHLNVLQLNSALEDFKK